MLLTMYLKYKIYDSKMHFCTSEVDTFVIFSILKRVLGRWCPQPNIAQHNLGMMH